MTAAGEKRRLSKGTLRETAHGLPLPFLAAMVIDAFGSGAFMPFVLLYFSRVQTVDIALAGVVLGGTHATLVVMSGPLGNVVQRWSPLAVLVMSNWVRAAVFAVLVLRMPLLAAIVVLAFSTVLDKVVWVSQGAGIAQLVSGSERRRAFSTIGWARNLGIGLGAFGAGWLYSTFGAVGLQSLALVNASSFALAAVLIAHTRRSVQQSTPAGSSTTHHPMRVITMLHRRGFSALVAAKTCYAASATALSLCLGASLVQDSQLDAWVAGTVFAVNAGIIVLLQPMIVRLTASLPAATLMVGGGALYTVAGAGFLGAIVGTDGNAALVLVFAGIIVYTFGEIAVSPSSDAMAADLAEPGREAPFISLYQASWSIASVFVPLIGAPLIGYRPDLLWIGFALLGVLGALFSLRLMWVPSVAGKVAATG